MFHSNFIGIVALLLSISLCYGFIVLWNRKLKSVSINLGITESPNKWIRIFGLTLTLLLLFYLDFIRDYAFKNLNWRMDFMYHMEQGGSPEKYVDGTDSWAKAILGDTSSQTLYKLKYIISGIFILIYAFIAHLTMRWVYPKFNTLPYTLLLYGLGVLMMGLVFSFYFFTWSHDTKLNFYLISMEIGHFLESSLPTLLSILGFKIYLSTQETKSNE